MPYKWYEIKQQMQRLKLNPSAVSYAVKWQLSIMPCAESTMQMLDLAEGRALSGPLTVQAIHSGSIRAQLGKNVIADVLEDDHRLHASSSIRTMAMRASCTMCHKTTCSREG